MICRIRYSDRHVHTPYQMVPMKWLAQFYTAMPQNVVSGGAMEGAHAFWMSIFGGVEHHELRRSPHPRTRSVQTRETYVSTPPSRLSVGITRYNLNLSTFSPEPDCQSASNHEGDDAHPHGNVDPVN